ncbi:MAG: FAD-dependent oxidoreductase [Treponema sp.]|nr:FAD-dependent oxidoreductase [Treponema sp.]
MEIDADLLIIGAGPAGLTAAQYGARANLKVLVIEQLAPGGQVLLIDVLENYPGNIERKDAAGNSAGPRTGFEIAQDMHSQAEAFGASFLNETVTELAVEGGVFTAVLASGEKKKALAVIMATGAVHRNLDIPGEQQFLGRGVSHCATCDGAFFRNKKIVVVGGGDAACDDAQYLSRLSPQVVLIHRRDRFRAQKALAERVLHNPHIEVRFNTIMKEIKGEQKLSSVVLEHEGTVYEESADAVFIFAGTVPQSSLVREGGVKAALDDSGYIITDQKMAASVPGLFAAGDVRSGTFRQVVVAAGEGAVAAHNAAEYIDRLRGAAYN